jgi:hypothetical protein
VLAETDVLMIHALPNNVEKCVNMQFFQILHDNWPALIALGKHSGLRPKEVPAAKHSSLHGYNANYPITVSDGTLYLPPAGGTFASSKSQADWVNCNKDLLELYY